MEATIGVALALVVFAAFGLRNLAKSAYAGVPRDDEFTKRARTSAAAFAFYTSLYMWGALIYFEDSLEQHRLPPLAIVGSALIFGLRYLYLVKRGRLD